jgi:glutathione synthase/RimK-type ligase-like ATP-grasp enzyme
LVVMDDPWSILYCANKVYLNECLKQKKIPTPQTVVLSKDVLKKTKEFHFKYPVILKQPDSAFSLGVHKVENETELSLALKKLFKSSDLVIAQEFTPSEFDWRIGILDGKPLFACKYYMAKGHWQVYNWKASGDDYVGLDDALAIEDVPPKVLKMALKAASLIGDGFYGIDLKEYRDEVYLIEINDNPNIDHKVEDRFLGDKLYDIIMKSFMDRIEAARGVSRYVSYAPSVKRSNAPKFQGGQVTPVLPAVGEVV